MFTENRIKQMKNKHVKHIANFHGKEYTIKKLNCAAPTGLHMFLDVDDIGLKLQSVAVPFFTLLMLSIWVGFILC